MVVPRFQRAGREDKCRFTGTFQALACATLAKISLVNVKSKASPEFSMEKHYQRAAREGAG